MSARPDATLLLVTTKSQSIDCGHAKKAQLVKLIVTKTNLIFDPTRARALWLVITKFGFCRDGRSNQEPKKPDDTPAENPWAQVDCAKVHKEGSGRATCKLCKKFTTVRRRRS